MANPNTMQLQRFQGLVWGNGVQDSRLYFDGHSAYLDVMGRGAGSPAFTVRAFNTQNVPLNVFQINKDGAVSYDTLSVVNFAATGEISQSYTDSATTGSSNAFDIAATYSAAAITGTQTGLNVLLSYSGGTSAVDLRGIFSVAQSTSTGTVSTLFANYGRVTKSGAGTVTVGYAHYGVIQSSHATGEITDGHCFYAATPSVSAGAEIITQTGLNVENQGATGVTHAYGIHIKAQSGAATTNVGLRNNGTTHLHDILTARADITPQAGGSIAIALGSGANGPRLCMGSGAPSLGAAKGSLYLRTDGDATNNRAYINTDGSTTWTPITTAG